MCATLAREYHLALDYIEGGYRYECAQQERACSFCRIECCLRIRRRYGITPSRANLLFGEAVSEQGREMMRECFYRTGKLTGDEEARKEFPYDVEYFSEAQIHEKGKFDTVMGSIGMRAPRHAVWDGERQDACRGKQGMVAKRCSMNDTLWAFYRMYPKITLADVKNFVSVGALARKYPNSDNKNDIIKELRSCLHLSAAPLESS